MLAPLDIFKMQDGTYVWKAEADTFELAKSIPEELGSGTPSCLGDQMHFENAFSRCRRQIHFGSARRLHYSVRSRHGALSMNVRRTNRGTR